MGEGEDERPRRVVLTALLLASLIVLLVVRVRGADAPASTTSTTSTTTVPVKEEAPSAVTAAQLDGIGFTDVTAEAGLDRTQAATVQKADEQRSGYSSGAAAADIDGDGDTDLYVTRLGQASSLYRNDGGGRFTDIAVAAGVDRTPTKGNLQGSSAAAFADVDGDGCLDLYVASASTDPPALFVNDCAGRFTDQATERGLGLPAPDPTMGAQGHGATFADFDHDGDLDLLALHWDTALLSSSGAVAAWQADPDPDSLCDIRAAAVAPGSTRNLDVPANRSRLYRNDGTGHFTDATAAVGLDLANTAGFTGDFVDVDGDGWEDLLIAGDFCTSRLFRNDGGTGFTDVTDAAGVGTDENGMGSVVRDVDGDGRPDWFVTSIAAPTVDGRCPSRAASSGCSGNRLYRNLGGGRFADATDDLGVRDGWWGWGAAIEDFANDGRLSVVQTNGSTAQGPGLEGFADDPMRLWVRTGSDAEPLEEAAVPAGLTSTAVGHALIPFDADGDGDLDLFIANFGGPPNLYRNDAPSDRHHVTVRLDDPRTPGNRAGLGAKVRVTSAGRSTTGWISTGGSYESQRLPELHVGLGTSVEPVTIEVWWPGDDQPQVVRDAPIDRVVTVTAAAR